MTLIDVTKLNGIVLSSGGHESPEEGLCLLECVAFVAGEPHSDHPACVSAVLGAFGRNLNDVLPDGLRQKLIPLIPDLPGTAGDGHDGQRGYLALDWLIRTWLPAWLDLSPACRDDAAKLRDLGRLVDLVSAERAGPVVRQAKSTAWDAAWAAARDAAWAAARDAAWAAARDAAWDAAWAAAWDAAWDAARAAAWDAARDAARDAAWAAARDAARDAAWAAARAAARAALQPTVIALQTSAIDLYGQMIRVGR